MDWLLVIWILSLPLSWILSHYTGIVAPDKLLAVLLLAMGYLLLFKSTKNRFLGVTFYTIIIALFILLKNLSFIASLPFFGSLVLRDAIQIGYFLVPLVCVSTETTFRKACWAVAGCAVLGCLSVFLVSIGFLKLPLERFEVSRIGIAALPKSIGLFTSYGDLAQYLAFAAAWLYVAPRRNRFAWSRLSVQRIVMAAIAFLGLLGAQSRNILASLALAFVSAWFFNRTHKTQHKRKGAAILGFLAAGLILASLSTFSAGYVVDLVTGLGGSTAEQTVKDRFKQYDFAWEIIKASPLLGADIETYQKYSHAIDDIHNFWLKTAAQGGIVAVIPLLLLLGTTVASVWHAGKSSDRFEEALVVKAYLTVMFFATLFYSGQGELFWALLGIGASQVFVKADSRVPHEDILPGALHPTPKLTES